MRSENKTRFLPAVEPSSAGFISDSVPTGEPSPAGFIYLLTEVRGQAPKGGCTQKNFTPGFPGVNI